MEVWLQQLFAWLPDGPFYYGLVGLIAFVESLALVGIFCPGSVIAVFTGFLAANGKGDFALLVAVSSSGAIGGDLVSYFLGARYGQQLLSRPLFLRHRELFAKAEAFFYAHGGKSIFLGRFVGFLRPFIPFIAGSARMRPLPFTLFVFASGILWGLAYPGLGYLGGASWKLVELWFDRFSLFLLILIVLFVLNALFWRKLAPHLAVAGRWLWRHLAARSSAFVQSPAAQQLARRYPRLCAFCSERFSLAYGSGLYLTAGLVVSTLFAWLFLLTAANSPRLLALDRSLYTLVQSTRHPWADHAMVAITTLANGTVVLCVGFLLFLWLLLRNRDFSALILLVGIGGGELLVAVLKLVYARSRPEPLIAALQLDSAGLPSGHAFSALVLSGLCVYFLLGDFVHWRDRLGLVIGASLLSSLIGFSRIYLGLHWTTDVFAGFALAALWLTFLITACEIRRRYGGEFPWQQGYEPLHLRPFQRRLVLIVAALGVAALSAWEVVQNLRVLP